MRSAVAGALAVCVLAAVLAALVPSVGLAERAVSGPQGGGSLIAIEATAGEHRQQLTVIDPQTQSLAVYHIDTASGEVTLKSVRNIHYDLKMIEFNATSPLPREIRALLDTK